MCINFNGYHFGGSSFVNVNECWFLQKSFVHYRYKFSSEKKEVPVYGFAPRNRFGFANRVGPGTGHDSWFSRLCSFWP